MAVPLHVVSFVTGPMTGVFVGPSGLRIAIDGSFLSIRRQSGPRFCTQVSGKLYRRAAFNIKMMAENGDPLDPSERARRQQIPITAETPTTAPPSGPIKVPVADLQLPMSSLELREVDGRTQLIAEVGPEGIPVLELPDYEGIVLTPELLEESDSTGVDTPGCVPSNVSSVEYFPTKELRKEMEMPKDGRWRKKGGSIYGTDDRNTFKPVGYPWRATGLIRSKVGTSSGVCIGPRHVLTASHSIEWKDNGKAGWVSFSPAYYDGNELYGRYYAERYFVYSKNPKWMTKQEIAFDYVVLVMKERVGDRVGWVGSKVYDTRWNGRASWEYVGYADDLDSGRRPAFQDRCVVYSTQTETLGGRTSFVLEHYNEFTPRQSGGPAWGWFEGNSYPSVIGVGSTDGDFVIRQPYGPATNEYAGGQPLVSMIIHAREKYP